MEIELTDTGLMETWAQSRLGVSLGTLLGFLNNSPQSPLFLRRAQEVYLVRHLREGQFTRLVGPAPTTALGADFRYERFHGVGLKVEGELGFHTAAILPMDDLRADISLYVRYRNLRKDIP